MNNIRNAERIRKCAYEPCQCLVPLSQEYCSAFCSDADDVENNELQCNCGHGKCVSKRTHRIFAVCIEDKSRAVNSTASGRADVMP